MESSIWKEESTFQTTRKYESKYYEKITIQQILNIQDNNECLS